MFLNNQKHVTREVSEYYSEDNGVMMLMVWRLGLVMALPFFILFFSPVEAGGKLTGKPLSSISYKDKDSQPSPVQENADSKVDPSEEPEESTSYEDDRLFLKKT